MSATLAERLVESVLDGYDAGVARRAGGRALFDHLACLHAGRRIAPASAGDAGAAAAGDRDDLHWPSLTHPGAVVWTVLRAAGAEGEPGWRAAYAGYEVTARLGAALGTPHRRHWHVTTTAGTVGGAVAGALALGSDPVAAACHAISVAGGSIVPVLERSGTHIVHRDHASAAALRCAQAARDTTATRSLLEHPQGFFAAMGGDPAGLLDERDHAAIDEITFRCYATTGFAHALVAAARRLAPIEPAGDIVVEAPPAAVALAHNPAPRDPEEAWWSCEHAVAVTLLGLDLEDDSLVADARVAALRTRVRLTTGTTSRVTVDGRSAACEEAPPATDDDLVAKWRTLNPDIDPPLELLA